MKPKYEVVEHTADVAVKVTADTAAELLANAAGGMFDLIGDIESIRPHVRRSVEIDADDYEELMVNWLTELLFRFETERLLLCEFDIEEIDSRHLRATVGGEEYDPRRHELQTDIKAVTYSGLHVEHSDDEWTATVVFDI